jgi:transglutaminase-like putative cysteine protease
MNDEQKWQFLQEVPARDAQHPEIIRLAKSLRFASYTSEARLASLCMCVARDWIKQTSDVTRTGGEDIAGLTREPGENDAVEALDRGKDDCDAKARLFVALCLAGGLRARMVPRWNQVAVSETTPNGRTLTHVSAEVVIAGQWRPVELTLARARLGEVGEQVPKEIKTGKWLLP